jgi:sulfotransferase family protein
MGRDPLRALRARMVARRMRSATPPGPPAPFIVGVGRSGTTLLRLMLDAHPEMAIPPETHFLPAMVESFGAVRVTPERLLDAIKEAPQSGWIESGVNEEAFLSELRALRPLNAPDSLRAFFRLYAERHGKTRFGEKTPRYVESIDVIAGALPEARFIHMIRDGRDVALSTNKRLVELRGTTPVPIKKMAKRWRGRITGARRAAADGRYLEVRYEDLVLDTEPVLRKVAEFVELEWDPVMLSYHERASERLQEMNRDHERAGRKGGVLTGEERMKAHALTSAPPQADRTAVWKTDMEAADIAAFEDVAGDLLAELGYETAASPAPS